jgi:hypothetical protein
MGGYPGAFVRGHRVAEGAPHAHRNRRLAPPAPRDVDVLRALTPPLTKSEGCHRRLTPFALSVTAGLR